MQHHRLPPSIEERLKFRAQRTGRSIGEVAREAVLDEIDAIEDYYFARALLRQQDQPATTTGTRGANAHISS